MTNGNVRLFSVYNHTHHGATEEDLKALMSVRKHIILMGDFNTKSPIWNNRTTNPNGRMLQTFGDARAEITVIGSPTRTTPTTWTTEQM